MYQVRKLVDNVYTFEEGVRVRCFLVVGRQRAVLLDSGNGLVDFERELPKLTDLPVFLINTHGDPDHIAKNALFDTRYVHPADLELIRAKQPEDTGAYLPLAEGDVFDLGGTELTVIECPGHTPGSVMLYDRARKYLYAGDTLSDRDMFLFGAKRNQRQFVDTLHALLARELEVDTVFACHGACPLTNYTELTRDICGAVTAYLEGKPETDILHIERGPLNKYLKRYAFGCTTVLTEEVEATALAAGR